MEDTVDVGLSQLNVCSDDTDTEDWAWLSGTVGDSVVLCSADCVICEMSIVLSGGIEDEDDSVTVYCEMSEVLSDGNVGGGDSSLIDCERLTVFPAVVLVENPPSVCCAELVDLRGWSVADVMLNVRVVLTFVAYCGDIDSTLDPVLCGCLVAETYNKEHCQLVPIISYLGNNYKRQIMLKAIVTKEHSSKWSGCDLFFLKIAQLLLRCCSHHSVTER